MPENVSAPMPALDLVDGTIVTVTLDDASAVISQLIVHVYQELPSLPSGPLPPVLALDELSGGPD